MKDAIIVALAAGAGEYLDSKYGASIEAQGVALHIPPVIAHVAVVGGFTAVVWYIARKFV
jgi:hypothetical protein